MTTMISQIIFWIDMIPLMMFAFITANGLANLFDKDSIGTDE